MHTIALFCLSGGTTAPQPQLRPHHRVSTSLDDHGSLGSTRRAANATRFDTVSAPCRDNNISRFIESRQSVCFLPSPACSGAAAPLTGATTTRGTTLRSLLSCFGPEGKPSLASTRKIAYSHFYVSSNSHQHFCCARPPACSDALG